MFLSPGIGYDTSTSLLLHRNNEHGVKVSSTPNEMPDRLFNLVRWDAIYYVQMARMGHVFEQEWAFGVGLSGTISWLTRCK